MTTIDWLVLAVVLISCAAGVMRGFVREAMALAGWILAFLAARLVAPSLSAWVPGVESAALRHAVAIVAVFILVLVLAGLLGRVLGGMVKWAGLAAQDRFLGLLFGGVRASLILVLFSLLAGLTALPKTDDWREAHSRGWLEAAAGWVLPWLPGDLAGLVDYHTPTPEQPSRLAPQAVWDAQELRYHQ